MPSLSCFYLALLILSTHFSNIEAARKSSDSVLLSNVKTLTLRKDLKTSHRRVGAVPQLKCTGGSAKGLYEVDVMRCKNQGSDYEDENVQWTCTASLPSEFKLGSTDVICEGYNSSDDPYVLKGSCGVEYRLVLTNIGEEKYGRKGENVVESDNYKGPISGSAVIFWGIFLSVVAWMIYSAFFRNHPNRAGGGNNALGWGGGGGGGNDGDDPPPPYDYHSSPKPSPSTSAAGAPPAANTQGWRPGFWTGAAGGAAAAYLAGNRGQTQQPRPQESRPTGQTNRMWNLGNNGEGSSSTRTRSSGSSGSSGNSFSGARHESSGFGSTSRR